jgi:hypothetical protein
MSGVQVGAVYHLFYAVQAGKHGIGVVTGTITER